MREILHISMIGGTGDVIICTPIFKALKQTFPEKYIMVYCWKEKQLAPLYNNPYIDKIKKVISPYQKAAFRISHLFRRRLFIAPCFYDAPLVISKKNVRELLAETIGLPVFDSKPELYLTPAEKSCAIKLLRPYEQPIVLLHAYAGATPNHRWPIEYWNQLVRSRPEYIFVQIGLPSEPALAGVVDLRGKTTTRVMFALAKYACSFVGLDACLSHVSQAFDLRGVVLFGDSSPVHMGHDNNINIYLGLDCSPCVYLSSAAAVCPYGQRCMTQISPEMVAEALDTQIAISYPVSAIRRRKASGDDSHSRAGLIKEE